MKIGDVVKRKTEYISINGWPEDEGLWVVSGLCVGHRKGEIRVADRDGYHPTQNKSIFSWFPERFHVVQEA